MTKYKKDYIVYLGCLEFGKIVECHETTPTCNVELYDIKIIVGGRIHEQDCTYTDFPEHQLSFHPTQKDEYSLPNFWKH